MQPDRLDAIRRRLDEEPRIRFALAIGSVATGREHAGSDLDLAIEARPPLAPRELGALIADLEALAGRRVDLIDLDRAPAFLAYRAFRDGQILVEHDRGALVARKARAILDYLDWRPVEQRLLEGVRRRLIDGRS